MVRNYVSRKKSVTYDIDEKLLKSLCDIQCTNSEISAIIGVSVDTLARRYADKIIEWREAGKSSLRRAQWRKALYNDAEGDTVMLKHLGKVYLKQGDEVAESMQRTLFDRFNAEMTKKGLADKAE